MKSPNRPAGVTRDLGPTRRKFLSAIAGVLGMILTKGIFASDKRYDGVTSATIDSPPKVTHGDTTSKVVLVLKSFHHKNTEKVACIMAKALNAQIISPLQIRTEELNSYDLIGFGSGIYDQKHHQSIIDLVDKLSSDAGRKVFIFSTSGVSRKTCLKHSIDDPHAVIRRKLQAKGCQVIDEYNCAGWNTNSFLKIFGGINNGKPNDEDLKQAKEFAMNLKY
jgi:flavodoxin